MAQDIIEFGMHQNTSRPENDNNENNIMIYTFNYHVSIAFIAGFTERLAKLLQTNNRNNDGSQVNEEQGEKNNKTPLRRKNEHVEAI